MQKGPQEKRENHYLRRKERKKHTGREKGKKEKITARRRERKHPNIPECCYFRLKIPFVPFLPRLHSHLAHEHRCFTAYLPVMSSGLASDEVAEDYKNSLEDLTTNDRFQISNLTVIAKENTEHAMAISRVLENHIRTVGGLCFSLSCISPWLLYLARRSAVCKFDRLNHF